MEIECEVPSVHVGLESEGGVVHDEGRAQRLAEAVQRGAQGVLSGGAIKIGPENSEQVIAGERVRVGRQIVDQRAAFPARDVEGTRVEQELGRAEESNGQHVRQYN